MGTPANLTEDDLLAIGNNQVAKILAVPEKYRPGVISTVKKIIKHEAYGKRY